LGAAALGVSVVRVLRIGEPVKCEHWNRTAAAWTREPESGYRRDGGNARPQLTREQRRHSSSAREPGRIHTGLVGAHVFCNIRDHIRHVGHVISPVALNRNVPTSTLRFKRRDDESFGGAERLETAVSCLPCRVAAAAMQIENEW